jgi:Matrixin
VPILAVLVRLRYRLKARCDLPDRISIAIVCFAAATAIVHSGGGQVDGVATRVTYFIAEGDPRAGYRPSDRQLARRAFDTWSEHSAGAITWAASAREEDALVRLYWSSPGEQAFGEMRSLVVNGRQGAAVFVRADMNGLGADLLARTQQDPLWRDTIVYLTCLHELGHALGLAHTADFQDIMYFFGYGGDIVEYFGRYRRQIRSPTDMAKVSGLSESDIVRLRRLHPAAGR